MYDIIKYKRLLILMMRSLYDTSIWRYIAQAGYYTTAPYAQLNYMMF